MKPSPKHIWRIALVVPSNYEYVQRLSDGLLRYKTDRGDCVMRDFRFDFNESKDLGGWASHPRPWADWHPDGLIVHLPAEPGLIEWVSAGGVPTVNTSVAPTEMPSVHLSADGVARVAIEHFESLGFQHFAYAAVDSVDPRFDAFQTRLKNAKRPVTMMNYGKNPEYWDDDIESTFAGAAELEKLLRQSPKPLAVLAFDDNVGRVVCRAAMKLGLAIPWDIGVLGVNNFSMCRTCDPPLSSIHAPGDEVGYRAMEVLMGMLKGRPAPAHHIEVEPGKVYARASTVGEIAREADLTHAMEVIREQACNGVSVNEVVEELHMSRSTLYREFVNTIGRTPSEEIARIRTERAKELLGKTRIPIRRIAAMLGYPTPANFTTFFKTQTGITPRAFRVAGQ